MDDARLDEPRIDELIRFNEAIDQAIAESVGHFHAEVEQQRNLFLGMLGHDMRNPLNAIVSTASYLACLNAGEKVYQAADLLIRSGASMQSLLNDLVDFNRTKLGLGLNISRSEVDLSRVAEDELNQFRAAYPERPFEMTAAGNLLGFWDGSRLHQLLRNLLSNAVRYGYEGTPIHLNLDGDDRSAVVSVSNSGPEIDPLFVRQIFDPLTRGFANIENRKVGAGLGLGLFIVREIASSHGGTVDVSSSCDATTFTVTLPKIERKTDPCRQPS